MVNTAVTLTFDGELDPNSMPAADAFTVRVDGAEVSLASADAVSVSGRTVTLTLPEAVEPTASVEVRYVQPTGDSRLRNPRGNPVASFDFTAADNTTDTTPPRVSGETPPAVTGARLTITFNETLNARSVPAPGDFTVSVDEGPREVTGVFVSGNVVTLTLARRVTRRQDVSVSYTPGANPLADLRGNLVLSFNDQSVSNLTPNSPRSSRPTRLPSCRCPRTASAERAWAP